MHDKEKEQEFQEKNKMEKQNVKNSNSINA